MEVGGAVHGQAGHAVQEVSEGEVDYEDGGVLQGGDVEAEYLVGLSPGNGSQGEEVTSSSNDGDDNAAGIELQCNNGGRVWCHIYISHRAGGRADRTAVWIIIAGHDEV